MSGEGGVGRDQWEGGVAVTGGAAYLASVEMYIHTYLRTYVQSDNSTVCVQ